MFDPSRPTNLLQEASRSATLATDLQSEVSRSYLDPNFLRVCVFTGTRAEYGQLYWLLRSLADHPAIELQVLVSGTHLSTTHGRTVDEILADGFVIDEQIDMLLAGDSPVAIAKSMGLAAIGFADALRRLSPDVLVVHGDRYEAFVAAQTALILRVPVAHIHGGELTEGAFDDVLRHAITKLSFLHFAGTEEYRRRIIQLGEEPSRVTNVGTLSVESIRRTSRLSREELATALGHELRAPSMLVTYHPATMSVTSSTDGITALLAAMDQFPGAQVVFTAPNADPDAASIRTAIERYVADNPSRAHLHSSLGRTLYLNLLREVDVVVGNSSSGIIEAPSVCTPTVNVGDRQDGRPRAASVIDCAQDTDSRAIVAALRMALDVDFRASLNGTVSPYESNDTTGQIVEGLLSADLTGGGRKRFYDLDLRGPDECSHSE